MKIGDLISITGCDASNRCNVCASRNCSQFIKDGTITAIVTAIIPQHATNFDKIYFFPVLATEDDFVGKEHYFFTRRHYCNLLKSKPDQIVELQF